jgi:hypothetical protein
MATTQYFHRWRKSEEREHSSKRRSERRMDSEKRMAVSEEP